MMKFHFDGIQDQRAPHDVVFNWECMDTNTVDRAPREKFTAGNLLAANSCQGNRSGHTIQSNPRFWSGNAIRNKPASQLESAQGRLCFCAEVSVDYNSYLCLYLLHQLPIRGTAKGGSTGSRLGAGSRFNRRYERRSGGRPAQYRGSGRSQRIHIEIRIVFSTGR